MHDDPPIWGVQVVYTCRSSPNAETIACAQEKRMFHDRPKNAKKKSLKIRCETSDGLFHGGGLISNPWTESLNASFLE